MSFNAVTPFQPPQQSPIAPIMNMVLQADLQARSMAAMDPEYATKQHKMAVTEELFHLSIRQPIIATTLQPRLDARKQEIQNLHPNAQGAELDNLYKADPLATKIQAKIDYYMDII